MANTLKTKDTHDLDTKKNKKYIYTLFKILQKIDYTLHIRKSI